MDANKSRENRKKILDNKKRRRLQQENSRKRVAIHPPLANITNLVEDASGSVVDKAQCRRKRWERSTFLASKRSRISGESVVSKDNTCLADEIAASTSFSDQSLQLSYVDTNPSHNNSTSAIDVVESSNRRKQRMQILAAKRKLTIGGYAATQKNISRDSQMSTLDYSIDDTRPIGSTNSSLESDLHESGLPDSMDVQGSPTGLENIATGSENSVYVDLGDATFVCSWCHAKFWKNEALKPKTQNQNLVFSLCCGKGKVQLPFLADPPIELHRLFFGEDEDSSKFLEDIRSYNTCFAFTSMGGKVDRSVNKGQGRYAFRLSGQNHHRIGSLIPEDGQSPKFAQLYIYDTANETSNRIDNFSSGRTELEESIILKLSDVLDRHNSIAQMYRMARDRYESGEVHKLQLRLVRARRFDGRTYNLPTADEVAGLIVGDIDTSETHRDIIIEHQSGFLKRIDELHPSYLPLQYPLLFPYGDDGFREDILHSEASQPNLRKQNHLTLRQFFAFRLQERDFEISLLLFARRLLQQFIVDGYTMIESSRLSYIRQNQKKLRADLYSGVADAVSRGVSVGGNIGKRIILPSSFTGGPRYMIQHYQDAMAICRWGGYPHVFITFTCNPNWLEICRFMVDRGLKIEDRPDIVARIFKMKLQELMHDLMSGEIFGKVKAGKWISYPFLISDHCLVELIMAKSWSESIDCGRISTKLRQVQLH